MWQRVQTLYLALATALVAVLFFSPMAFVVGPGGRRESIAFVEKLPYLAILISIAAAQLFALVTYRARMVQMRVAVIAALLLAGFQAWLAVDFFRAPDAIVFRFTAVFPVVAAILDFLAARAIFSDELLVRSSSRLRAAKRK
ncbi:MAG: DUF4293 domain-containing protein [Bacteroidales bacterium]|nr:DUF4293 domain-containing protein [Bacteroidales bacterium]